VIEFVTREVLASEAERPCLSVVASPYTLRTALLNLDGPLFRAHRRRFCETAFVGRCVRVRVRVRVRV
jgi:hypothetical protein